MIVGATRDTVGGSPHPLLQAIRLKKANHAVKEVERISTYEEFMIMIGVAGLIIAILNMRKEK